MYKGEYYMSRQILEELLEEYLSDIKKYENDFLTGFGKDTKIKNYKSSDIATSFLSPVTKKDEKKIVMTDKANANLIKESYDLIIRKLRRELIKNYILENISPNTLRDKKELNKIVDNIEYSVKSNLYNFTFESISMELKPIFASMVEDIQYDLYKFKKLLKNDTRKFLKEFGKLKRRNNFILEFVGRADETIPIKPDSGRLSDLANRFQNELISLKNNFETCNERFDSVEKIGNCQLTNLENSLGNLKTMMDDCQNNEECRSKFIEVIGRLEILYDKIVNVIKDSSSE